MEETSEASERVGDAAERVQLASCAVSPSLHLPPTGVVIPTLNAGRRWSGCLEALACQSLKLRRCLIVDSGSEDETVPLAREWGAEVEHIRRAEFNHGGTRRWALEQLDDCEIVVFLTQDAVPATSISLEQLVKCLEEPKVAVAYGRQLPHLGARPLEAHARLFSYGPRSELKDLSKIEQLGASVFFCSNSFAAYRRATFMELGGFRTDLILGEDAEYAARAVMAGYINVYCAEALVYHSHNYSVTEVFRRYFDTGVFHSRNGWLEQTFGSHGVEGLRFVLSELVHLAKRAPLQIPRSVLHTLAKVAGYRLGKFERALPVGLKRHLSMMASYWNERQ